MMWRKGLLCLLLAIASGCMRHPAALPASLSSAPVPQPVNAFQAYARLVEARIEADGPSSNFLRLARDPQTRARLRNGEILTSPAAILGIAPSAPTPGGEVQHWLGSLFVPRATLVKAIPRLQNYKDRKRYMWPEVVESRQLGRQGSDFQVYLRLSETAPVTGIFDAYLRIVYRRLDDTHLIVESRSERIAEVAATDRGLLWSLNHYWRIVESDGGLYLECEALVLSRRTPVFVRLIADPQIAQAARNTLIGTLEATRRMVESR